MILTQHCDSPLGGITLVSDGEALTGLYFDGQKHMPAIQGTEAELAVFETTRRWLAAYFAGERPDDPPKLALSGTPFRKRVWEALLRIPYGETVSYAALAKTLRSSARAVGGAVGRNPVALIVPCHRVIGKNGALTGYAGGLARKESLLALEQKNGPSSEAGANMGQPA